MKQRAGEPGGVLRHLAVVVLTTALLLPGFAAAVGDRGADGEFARRDSFHFTLFQDVDIDESAGLYGSRKFEQDLLRELEAAFDRLDQILGLRPEGKLVVYVWDPALFDAEAPRAPRGFVSGNHFGAGGPLYRPAPYRTVFSWNAFEPGAPEPGRQDER